METVITPYIPRRLTDEELVGRDAPHVKHIFWTYFAVLVVVSMFSYVVLGDRRYDLHLLFNDLALFVTTCVIGLVYRQSLAVQVKQLGFDKLEAWIGLGLLAPTIGLNYLYHILLLRPIMPHETHSFFDHLRADVPSEATIVFAFCIFPAITEEIAFRGLVQHWLQAAISPWKAIAFASFLFAAMHFSIVSFPYLLLVGMLLGWTKWKTGSLYPSMLIHFLHNFIVIETFPM